MNGQNESFEVAGLPAGVARRLVLVRLARVLAAIAAAAETPDAPQVGLALLVLPAAVGLTEVSKSFI
jgi:hypothetical protein